MNEHAHILKQQLTEANATAAKLRRATAHEAKTNPTEPQALSLDFWAGIIQLATQLALAIIAAFTKANPPQPTPVDPSLTQ